MKSSGIKKKLTAAILFLCLTTVCTALPCSAITGCSEQETSPPKAALSKSTLTMYPNTAKQLRLNHSASRVKWSSTDPKLVSILGSRGTNQQTVTIKSGNKTGSCKIKAKIKGKSFICKVTVKDDSKISRARFVSVKKTSNNIIVKIKLCNRGKKEIGYGHPYTVEKFVDGSWKKVGPPDDVAFDCAIYPVPGHSSKTLSYAIATKRDKNIQQFTKGTYRLTINSLLKYNYVLFSL